MLGLFLLFAFLTLFPLGIVLLRLFQAIADLLDFMRRSLDSTFRFLLKRVQYVDHAGKLYRINGPVRTARFIFDNFENSGPAKTP